MHFFVPRSLDICSYCLMLMDYVHRISDKPRICPCQPRREEIILEFYVLDSFFICYLLFQDTNHGWPSDSMLLLPIWCPVCRSCSTGQWKYRRVV